MAESIQVLIVEDRQDDAEIMVIALESQNFDVTWTRVETAEEFIAHLSPTLDVILADYTLPRFNAPDALALLQHQNLDIPFIVVTGSVSEEAAVNCMKQGAADYLLKDRLSRLSEAVRHSLSQRNLRRIQRKTEQDLIVLGRAIDTSINAVVMTDLDGNVTFINRAVLDLWGINREKDILGKNIARLLSSSIEADYLVETLKRERSTKGQLQSMTIDGRHMILQYAASLVMDVDNQPLCLMGTFIDVTEQIKAEALRADLERERELRELKSRFVSMLVHDFRNPLASLQVQLSLIDKYHDRLTPEQVREKVEISLQQSHYINLLIDDVLMIGKMEYIASEFSPQPVQLNAFCQTVFDEFRKTIDTYHHHLEFEPSSNDMIYPLDTTFMRRAITNLLANAVKYSPDGGTVRLSIAIAEDTLKIFVSDQGIGIPHADRKRLFDGFFRATNVGSIEGTGLGLAIVKQVIEAHRGYIDVDSEVNQGTTFIIQLPR